MAKFVVVFGTIIDGIHEIFGPFDLEGDAIEFGDHSKNRDYYVVQLFFPDED